MQLQALDDEHLQAGAEAAVMDEEEQKMFETDQFRWAAGASYDRDRVACGVNYDQELGQRHDTRRLDPSRKARARMCPPTPLQDVLLQGELRGAQSSPAGGG